MHVSPLTGSARGGVNLQVLAMDMDHTTGHGGDSGGDSMSGMDMGDGGYMMKMYFHTGVTEMILFKSWMPTNAGSMAYSCAIIFLLAFLYEGLKYLREELHERFKRKTESETGSSTEILNRRANASKSWIAGVMNIDHVIQTFTHALQFFVSYLLMLVFMTYNVWLCLAVILGVASGFFVFGLKKEQVGNSAEHCQ